MEPTSISLIANLPFEVAQSCIEFHVLDAVLDPAVCHPLGIHLGLEQRLLLCKKKQHYYVTLTSHKPPPTSHSLIQRDFSKQLRFIALAFIATPVPLAESSLQGSRSPERFRGTRGGQRVERGRRAVKCLNVASFPHFNWAI